MEQSFKRFFATIILSLPCFCVSLSFSQQFEWAKMFDPANIVDLKITDYAMLEGNSHVMIGNYRGDVDFDFGSGQNIQSNSTIYVVPFILKTDIDGNFLWVKTLIGGDVRHVIQDYNGNTYVGGYTTSVAVDIDPGPGVVTIQDNQSFIMKLNQNGDLIWHTDYSTYVNLSDLAIDANNNLIVIGDFSMTEYFGTLSLTALSSISECFVVKYNNSGTVQWAKRLGGTSSGSFAEVGPEGVCIDAQNGIAIAGQFDGTIDFNPGPSTSSLTASGSGNSYFLCKLTADGDYVFAKNNGANNNGYIQDIVMGNAGNVFTTGEYDPISGASGIFVRKHDLTGNILWEKTLIGSLDATHIAVDNLDYVYFTGSSGLDSVDLDPTISESYLVNPSNYEFGFIVKLSTDGNYIWSHTEFENIIFDYSASSVWLRTFYDGLAITNDAEIYVVNSPFSPYTSLFKLNQGITGIDEFQQMNNSFIQPNPFDQQFTLKFPYESDWRVIIFDFSGAKVYERNYINSENVIIDSELLSSGLFILSFENEHEIRTIKLIKN